jgi:NADH-quinone oxidoreductase subunit N|tara:strand:- start:2336 stop:2437 length:102 start_codon:yes stop_codon:yes gene_type:complete
MELLQAAMVAITALSGTVIIGLAAQFFLVIPMT